MEKITLGFAILSGIFKRKITVANIDKNKLNLCNKDLWITHYKKNIYSIEGVLKPETKIGLTELDISATASLLEKASELKKNLTANSDSESIAIYLNMFLQSLLNSVDFVLTTKNKEVFNYWLMKNEKVDSEIKTLTSNYILKITNSL